MKKIKTAVIGLGRIGSLLEEDALREKPCTHAGAVAANEDCELAAGCDIDEERRQLFAEKWRFTRENPLQNANENKKIDVYSDAQEMIRVHKPQILIIATHPDSHCYYCCLAAKMNVPVVICEKPLADNITDARKIVNLTKREGSPVIITNHERRYSKDYIRAKAILESGSLGAILSVRAVLYMGRTRKMIDMLWHDGTHLADAVMFLTGLELKHRRYWGAKLNASKGTAWLEGELFPNLFSRRHRGTELLSDNSLSSSGIFLSDNKENNRIKSSSVSPRLREKLIPVTFEIGSGRDHLVFEIEFSCERGRLRIGNGIFEVWESAPSPYAEKFRSLKNTGEIFEGPTGYFANMLKDAVACVRDPQRTPVSGALDGLKVIEYLNSVKRWR